MLGWIENQRRATDQAARAINLCMFGHLLSPENANELPGFPVKH